MGLIREPKNVDFIIKSEPWTEKELKEFRKIMKAQKAKQKKNLLAYQDAKQSKKYNAQPLTAATSYAALLPILASRWTFVDLALRTAAQLIAANR